jgi:hypothetical protein
MGCAKFEVWNEQEARCGEAALLKENHREGGAEWDVDSGVLPRASAEGESVLLVAAQTERGWGERKVEDLTRGGAWLGKQRQARWLFDRHVQRLKITLAEQAGSWQTGTKRLKP